MRRICGGDGFGVPRAKRSACLFVLPKSQNEGPESIAGKIMVKYNSKAYTCTFRGPGQYVDFIVTKCFGPIKCYVWGKIGGL